MKDMYTLREETDLALKTKAKESMNFMCIQIRMGMKVAKCFMNC